VYAEDIEKEKARAILAREQHFLSVKRVSKGNNFEVKSGKLLCFYKQKFLFFHYCQVGFFVLQKIKRLEREIICIHTVAFLENFVTL
jgi:hypothetical protein